MFKTCPKSVNSYKQETKQHAQDYWASTFKIQCTKARAGFFTGKDLVIFYQSQSPAIHSVSSLMTPIPQVQHKNHPRVDN